MCSQWRSRRRFCMVVTWTPLLATWVGRGRSFGSRNGSCGRGCTEMSNSWCVHRYERLDSLQQSCHILSAAVNMWCVSTHESEDDNGHSSTKPNPGEGTMVHAWDRLCWSYFTHCCWWESVHTHHNRLLYEVGWGDPNKGQISCFNCYCLVQGKVATNIHV